MVRCAVSWCGVRLTRVGLIIGWVRVCVCVRARACMRVAYLVDLTAD